MPQWIWTVTGMLAFSISGYLPPRSVRLVWLNTQLGSRVLSRPVASSDW